MAALFPESLQIAAAACAVMALCGCVFALVAGVLAGGYRGARPHASIASAVLLKPLHGAEPRLFENLASSLAQEGAGEFTLLAGVHAETDGAVATARRLEAADPRARLVVDPRRRAHNGKIGNVMNLYDVAPPAELVVLSDSDISHPPGWLAAVAAALERPRAGVATCFYYGVASVPGPWARLSAMGVSYGFLPQSLVGAALGWRPAMGSTLALRRETLEAVGGFAAVKDVLADDYELGRAVTALGLEVVAAPVLVGHDSADADARQLWRQELRWVRTIRGLDPVGYAGSLVTHAIPLALLAWALSGLALWALGVLAACFACRLWLKGRIDAVAGRSAGPWWLLPVRDMLSLALFVAAWFTKRVDWRGSRFHVGREGELEPL